MLNAKKKWNQVRADSIGHDKYKWRAMQRFNLVYGIHYRRLTSITRRHQWEVEESSSAPCAIHALEVNWIQSNKWCCPCNKRIQQIIFKSAERPNSQLPITCHIDCTNNDAGWLFSFVIYKIRKVNIQIGLRMAALSSGPIELASVLWLMRYSSAIVKRQLLSIPIFVSIFNF